MTIEQLFAEATEEERFLALVASMQERGIDTAQWTSDVNTNLQIARLDAEAQAEGHNAARLLARASFLDTAEGEGLTRLAASHFSLPRYPAVHAEHLFLLASTAGAPLHVIAAGELLVGTPGSAPILFANTRAGNLDPGGKLILRCRAQEPGTAGNLAARSTLQLRDALVGVSVSNPPALLLPGRDANGGVEYVALSLAPVQIKHQAGGALAVLALGQLVRVTVSPTTTAAQVAAAINADALCSLLVRAQATGTGAGLVAEPAASPLTYTLTSSVVLAGQAEEPDGASSPPRGLRGRCATRWATLGAGGSEEAMLYWARYCPTGYAASPVTKATALSNRYGGSIAGAAGTVLVAGDAGALTPGDLAAVQSNFESPPKYAMGTLLSVETTTNRAVSLLGTVYLLRSANLTAADAKTLVLAALAAYQADLPIGGQGYKLYAQKVAARIEDAASLAIRNVVLSSPAADLTILYDESVILDGSGLAYEMVDA